MAARTRAVIAAFVLAWAMAGAAAAQGVDKPTWVALSPAEKQVLAPLANEWPHLSVKLRKHLLRAADHYYKMTPAAQARFQKRLRSWAGMTPQQREAARKNYLKYKTLSPRVQQSLRQKWVAQHGAAHPPEAPRAQPAPH